MKLFTVIGARPQFIKAAALSRAVSAHDRGGSHVQEVVVHTGQHYDYEMSRVFFDELPLPVPTHDLGVGSGAHGVQTGRMLELLEPLMTSEAPDVVVVYGDTNSTLAGALVAAKLHIPVAHVEAGLRSFNRRMPEEINRVLTDHVSRWLFCPTDTAVRNLAKEGIVDGVHLSGDVMYEMLTDYAEKAPMPAVISALGLGRREYALATVHRADNTDVEANLLDLFSGLSRVSGDIPVVCPLHPRTRAALLRSQTRALPASVHIVAPLAYSHMLAAEQHARAIFTDSGGVQKEAYWFGVPCVTLREETEWTETMLEGRNILAGCDSDRIYEAGRRLLNAPTFSRPNVTPRNAANAILEVLLSALDQRATPGGRTRTDPN